MSREGRGQYLWNGRPGWWSPFSKKGDWRVCSKYRGITLLSLPGKVYSTLLERRLQRIVEPQLQEEQCGFRPGSGTVDQLCTLSGLLGGRGSSDIWRELGVEPLLLCVERSQLRWFGHLIRMPPGHVQLGGDPGADPKPTGGIIYLYISRLWIPQEELESVAGEEEAWGALLSWLLPRPGPG